MGTTHHHLLFPLPPSFTAFPSLPLLNKFPNYITIRCSSTRSRPSTGPPHWDSNAEPTSTTNGRFAFNLQDDEDYDATKQRNWWSNYDYDYEDEDEDDADFVFDEEHEFWVFKLFRAFGWVLPAIAISLLLGTGPNAFLMALAVPLGQSALSLAIDKVWGRPSSSPKSRPRTKTKKKPFSRAASNIKTSEGQREENKNGKGRESYQSWVNVVGGSYVKGDRSVPRYGGWDELDKRVGTQKPPKGAPSQKANGLPKHQKKGKLSRIGTVRDTPLLLRLLIAAFPFLGSWTKLLF